MSELLVTRSGAILELCMNRPERKNALNLSLYSALARALNEASQNSAVRVIILCGASQCFTAGNDLQDFAQGAALKGGPAQQFMEALLNCRKPIIASVEGPAIGIGTTLLLHCDFVYASPSADFKLPFVSLGLCPEFAASQKLAQVVGLMKAKDWLLTGRSIPASEALQAGLLSDLCDDPLAAARHQAKGLAELPPAALRNTKTLIVDERHEIGAVIAKEVDMFERMLAGPEFAEAVDAFLNKRAPDFSRFD